MSTYNVFNNDIPRIEESNNVEAKFYNEKQFMFAARSQHLKKSNLSEIIKHHNFKITGS